MHFGAREQFRELVRERLPAVGVGGGHQSQRLGGVDVFLPLDDPHRYAGLQRLLHLRGAVQHRLEAGRFAADLPTVFTHIGLPETLVPVVSLGALLADLVGHHLPVSSAVDVALHFAELMIRLCDLVGVRSDYRRQSSELAPSTSRLAVVLALPGPPEAPLAHRQRLVEKVRHRQAEGFHDLLGPGLAAMAVQQGRPTMLAGHPADMQ